MHRRESQLTVDTGPGQIGRLAAVPEGDGCRGLLYTSNTLSIVDPAGPGIVATLPLAGNFAGSVLVDSSRGRVYVAGADLLTILDGG